MKYLVWKDGESEADGQRTGGDSPEHAAARRFEIGYEGELDGSYVMWARPADLSAPAIRCVVDVATETTFHGRTEALS